MHTNTIEVPLDVWNEICKAHSIFAGSHLSNKIKATDRMIERNPIQFFLEMKWQSPNGKSISEDDLFQTMLVMDDIDELRSFANELRTRNYKDELGHPLTLNLNLDDVVDYLIENL